MKKQSNQNNAPDALLERAYNLQNDEDTKALYEDWADTYDKTMMDGLGYLTPEKTADLLAQYLPNKKAIILDIGSGTGLAGKALFERGFNNLHALDYSAEMLRVADERGIYSNLIEADLNVRLDIKDKQYDAIICTGTFTHAHVNADCFDELIRILKPAAIIACTVHHDILVENGFDKKFNELKSVGK